MVQRLYGVYGPPRHASLEKTVGDGPDGPWLSAAEVECEAYLRLLDSVIALLVSVAQLHCKSQVGGVCTRLQHISFQNGIGYLRSAVKTCGCDLIQRNNKI